MFILVALVLLAVVALVIASVAVHILFSPLPLLLVAGILLWLTFRRRRYHR
jgi:hypothetical protein